MKRPVLWIILTAIAMLAVMARPASAQNRKPEQIAMDGVIRKVGGFSELVAKYGNFSGEFAWLLGARAGVTLNEVLWIGGAYYFKADDAVKADFRAGDRSPYLDFEYGGIDFEYLILPRNLIHFSFQALLGYGGYSFTDPEGLIVFENTNFYIFEPGVNFELNMTHWMRLQWGISLRILLDTSDDSPDSINFRTGRQVQEYDYGSSELTNLNVMIGLKFGGFE